MDGLIVVLLRNASVQGECNEDGAVDQEFCNQGFICPAPVNL